MDDLTSLAADLAAEHVVAKPPVRSHLELGPVHQPHPRAVAVMLDMNRDRLAPDEGDPVGLHPAAVIGHRARDLRRAFLLQHLHMGGDGGQFLHRGLIGRHTLEPVGILLLDEGGRHGALDEDRMVHHGGEEGQVMPDPLDLEGVQRIAHRLDGLGARGRPGAELGDHRVVIHGDLAALENAGVVADRHVARRRVALPFAGFLQRPRGLLHRRAIAREPPDRGQEAAIGVFRV